MQRTQNIKYYTISGLILLSIAILSSTYDSQRLAFAQITPAPEKAGGNDDSSSASNNSPDTNGSNNDDGNDASSGSSSDGQDDSDDSDTNDSDDEDQSATEEENPLLEAIFSKVRQELTAAGMTDLGF